MIFLKIIILFLILFHMLIIYYNSRKIYIHSKTLMLQKIHFYLYQIFKIPIILENYENKLPKLIRHAVMIYNQHLDLIKYQ